MHINPPYQSLTINYTNQIMKYLIVMIFFIFKGVFYIGLTS